MLWGSDPWRRAALKPECALQMSGLDETLERLDIRCNRFMKGSNRYKEGINTLSQSQASFADFLEEFCGGTDEESMMLGNEREPAPCCLHVCMHGLNSYMPACNQQIMTLYTSLQQRTQIWRMPSLDPIVICFINM